VFVWLVQLRSNVVAGQFSDAGQQEREPADQAVGADAVLEPVEDRPKQSSSDLKSRNPRSTSNRFS
jgi:hypothetical protein